MILFLHFPKLFSLLLHVSLFLAFLFLAMLDILIYIWIHGCQHLICGFLRFPYIIHWVSYMIVRELKVALVAYFVKLRVFNRELFLVVPALLANSSPASPTVMPLMFAQCAEFLEAWEALTGVFILLFWYHLRCFWQVINVIICLLR